MEFSQLFFSGRDVSQSVKNVHNVSGTRVLSSTYRPHRALDSRCCADPLLMTFKLHLYHINLIA